MWNVKESNNAMALNENQITNSEKNNWKEWMKIKQKEIHKFKWA